MNDIWREVGRTVRAAMRGTPETVRLCVLIVVVAAVYVLVLQYGG